MFFLTNNIAVLAIAAVLGSFAWVWGGTRGDLLLKFVPWTTFILFEVMLAFPQRMEYESIPASRLRVWRSVCSDRLTWVCVWFLALLLVPFFNTKVEKLPWCVNRIAHLNVFLWFLPSLLAMIAARHSLRRYGKRLLVNLLVWNGVALAALGFIQLYAGARGPFWTEMRPGLVFFASFAYPNMAGDYFTSLTFLAIGLWRWRLDEVAEIDARRYNSYQIFWKRHYPLIAVVILYFSALNTLSRSAILLSTLGTVILFLMAGLSRMKKLHRADRIRFGFLLFFIAVGISLFAMLFTPDGVRKELDTLDANMVLDRMTGKREYHADVACKLIAEHPVFGCGGWGYMFLSPGKIDPNLRGHGPRCTGTANVHNDHLQFLCEHGAVGYVLLVLIVVLAVLPEANRWRRMAKAVRFTRHTGLPWPKGFFCFPPMGIAIYLSAVATLIHACGDCPLRSPAVLSLFFVQLVLVDGFLPREDINED